MRVNLEQSNLYLCLQYTKKRIFVDLHTSGILLNAYSTTQFKIKRERRIKINAPKNLTKLSRLEREKIKRQVFREKFSPLYF
jgi:hypothetical protein